LNASTTFFVGADKEWPDYSDGDGNIMTIKLPRIINDYVNTSNAHDVECILACFSDDAVVRDEGKEFRGKEMIEGWLVKAIEKYKFQFKPVSVKDDNTEVLVAVQVSGTFDGSPIILDYHFVIETNKILSLTIE
jgi:SnoaL-like domain